MAIDSSNEPPSLEDLRLVNEHFPSNDTQAERRQYERFELTTSASIIRANGATLSVRQRDLSRGGVGMMHIGSIGNIGDQIIYKASSDTMSYTYCVVLQWQRQIPDTNFWISGAKIHSGITDNEDHHRYLKAANTPFSASSVQDEVKCAHDRIQSIYGTFIEDEHPFTGEIDGTSIVIHTERNRTMPMDEILPIEFRYDGKNDIWSALVVWEVIESIGKTQMKITGVLSNLRINN